MVRCAYHEIVFVVILQTLDVVCIRVGSLVATVFGNDHYLLRLVDAFFELCLRSGYDALSPSDSRRLQLRWHLCLNYSRSWDTHRIRLLYSACHIIVGKLSDRLTLKGLLLNPHLLPFLLLVAAIACLIHRLFPFTGRLISTFLDFISINYLLLLIIQILFGCLLLLRLRHYNIIHQHLLIIDEQVIAFGFLLLVRIWWLLLIHVLCHAHEVIVHEALRFDVMRLLHICDL